MNMKMILFGIAFLMINSQSFAKARYANKTEMIFESDAIAIVNITKVEKTEKQGKSWTYHQKASATIEQCLKGEVKGTIEIYGMENFECAQCNYEAGRFIVFLRKQEDFWTGANWNLGICPIKDDNVQWFRDDKTIFEMKKTPLQDAVDEISLLVEKQKKEPPNKKDVSNPSSPER